MKKKIAQLFYQWLIRKKNFSANEQETLNYMSLVIVGETIKFLIMLLLAFILGFVSEMLFSAFFIALVRLQTGGYHAKKDWQCLLLTGLHITLAITMAYWLPILPVGRIIILIIAILAIVIIAPIQSPERPYYGKEKRKQLKQQALLALLIPTALLSTSNQLIYINLIYWLIMLHVTQLIIVKLGICLINGKRTL